MTHTLRLHITPLTPELLPKLLAPPLLSQASDTSFHEVSNFPESNYGYLTLPIMEAQKLKKRLDGTVFKGKKLKIEEARKRKHVSTETELVDVQPEDVSSGKTRQQKRKRENCVLAGHELGDDRKVKRGWTEVATPRKTAMRAGKNDKKGKKAKKSEFTNKEELLFKTRAPANKTGPALVNANRQGKRGRAQPRETVVHEFQHRTKHLTFLRKPAGTEEATGEAADGDAHGRKVRAYAQSADTDTESQVEERLTDDERVSPSHDISSESDEKKTPRSSRNTTQLRVPTIREESESASDAHPKEEPEIKEPSESTSTGSSSDSSTDLNEAKAAATSSSYAPTSDTEGQHPLETLFRRPGSMAAKSTTSKELSIKPTPFSFFPAHGGEDFEPEELDTTEQHSTPATRSSRMGVSANLKRGPKPPTLAIPATPHTAMDKQWRAQRSAAPTPDTAAPNKTEFTKWFWENRGESNRAWKKNRREAKKEERAHESKRKRR